MLTGIKLRANPTPIQRETLSRWMGCSRVIWNAKVDEERYYRTFARKYYSVGTYAPIDQTAAHFKDAELTPWLSECPSQIIRNTAVNWYNTYRKFLKGICGRPKRHPKTDRGSIYLTRELFRFDRCADGVTHNLPNSLYIRKERGQYFVSFCYENGKPETASHADNLAMLAGADRAWLEENTIGVDRGVAVPVQAGDLALDYLPAQKHHTDRAGRYIKRLQRRLACQKKGSNRRNRIKQRLSGYHGQRANIRTDFAHQVSRTLVNSARVIVFEGLKTQRMTRRAKPKQDGSGRYLPNQRKAKSGLNAAILNAGWHHIESFTKYKAKAEGKTCFRVPAPYTSQECAACGLTHPDNRRTQDAFVCVSCGHFDNADRNAARIIKKRAIDAILHPGTGLTDENMLVTGRGDQRKTSKAKSPARNGQRSVKKEKGSTTLPLEALPL